MMTLSNPVKRLAHVLRRPCMPQETDCSFSANYLQGPKKLHKMRLQAGAVMM